MPAQHMATADTGGLATGLLAILAIGTGVDDIDLEALVPAVTSGTVECDVTVVSPPAGPVSREKYDRGLGDERDDGHDLEFRSSGGELESSVENRNEVIRLIREHEPDVVCCPHPPDPHAEHRYESDLIQDAAYMVAVPAICPETPPLEYTPIVRYL